MWIFISLGISAGLIAASINSFKDSPYENFEWLKFLRSLILGALAGSIYYQLQRRGIVISKNLGIVLLSLIPLERGMGELYKGFLKQVNHPEYAYALKNLRVPAGRYSVKLLLALALLVIYAVIVTGIVWLARIIMSLAIPLALKGLLVGFFSTLIVAMGGGVKDSQFEGFDIKKFFRSPLVGIGTGMILIQFTQEPLALVLSAIGLERTMVECYKTFITRRVRGVHKEKEIAYPQWLTRRWIFFLTYGVNVLLMLVLLFRESNV